MKAGMPFAVCCLNGSACMLHLPPDGGKIIRNRVTLFGCFLSAIMGGERSSQLVRTLATGSASASEISPSHVTIRPGPLLHRSPGRTVLSDPYKQQPCRNRAAVCSSSCHTFTKGKSGQYYYNTEQYNCQAIYSKRKQTVCQVSGTKKRASLRNAEMPKCFRK